ncbi:MAG: sugar phosphate nucleotidyltransferase [Planctomycetota bacterium]
MPELKKAVIPAAGLGTRQYPASSGVRKEFFPLVDRDGRTKPVLQVVVEEALAAGVDEVCIVCQPGAESDFRDYFYSIPDTLRPRFEGKGWALQQSEHLRELGRRLSYVEQPEQEGLGHAVWCAREWADGDPVLVLLGDHVYVSTTDHRCAAQLADRFEGPSITALVPVGPEELSRFGVVGGALRCGDARMVEAECFLEKPEEQQAREHCRIEGLPEDTYLVHFGMHAFSPSIFEVLDQMVAEGRRENGEFQLTTAQNVLCRREEYRGLIMDGHHYDTGTPAGMLEAELALALSGEMAGEVREIWARAVQRHL